MTDFHLRFPESDLLHWSARYSYPGEAEILETVAPAACDRGDYPILDYRALWSVSMTVPAQYTFDFWWAYTTFVRDLRDRTGLTMRVLDRALWQYSKEHQPQATTAKA